MSLPEVGRPYALVRHEDGKVDFAWYIRFIDGSGVVRADGVSCMFELDPETWRVKWAALIDGGYIKVSDAIKRGIVRADVVPPAPAHVFVAPD